MEESGKPLYSVRPEAAGLHISKGNSKIGPGIWSFSTLPGDAAHPLRLADGTLLTDIPGTCGPACESCFGHGCYAVRDAKLHHNATIRAWGENTLLLRSGRLWGELEAFLTLKNGRAIKLLKGAAAADGTTPPDAVREARGLAGVKAFRIDVSGEVEDEAQLAEWTRLAARHPETLFGVYTKRYGALGAYLDAHPEGFPPNMCVNVSQWRGCADAFLAKYAWAGLNVFEYDPTNRAGHGLTEAESARLAKAAHCPAVTKEGHHALLPDGSPVTCDHCMRCYRKTGALTAVWSH